jgi:DNA-directed RNA polymerase subunit RPC12/RpoP
MGRPSKDLEKKALQPTSQGTRAAIWKCARCGRSFTQKNQRHACGTGDSASVLRNRPDSVVRLYKLLEAFARSLGPIEVVARDRYVLLRSVRIFADLVIMADAVRIAIHLKRTVNDPIFFKVGSGARHVTHVAKLQTQQDFRAIKPYVKEAYLASLEVSKR